jgi:hypothetical protein
VAFPPLSREDIEALEQPLNLEELREAVEGVHPQNVRFQNVRFQNVRFQNV